MTRIRGRFVDGLEVRSVRRIGKKKAVRRRLSGLTALRRLRSIDGAAKPAMALAFFASKTRSASALRPRAYIALYWENFRLSETKARP